MNLNFQLKRWVVRLQQVINAIREGKPLTARQALQDEPAASHSQSNEVEENTELTEMDEGEEPRSPEQHPALTRKDTVRMEAQRSNLLNTTFMSNLASKYSFINQ